MIIISGVYSAAVQVIIKEWIETAKELVRPTARMLFSQVAVITPVERVPTLMFRAANQRHDRRLPRQPYYPD